MNEVYNILILYGTYFLYLIGSIFILRLLFSLNLKNYHSNWNTLVDNFNFSSEEFYHQLREELDSQGIKKVYIHQVAIEEGNAFSQRRKYLRVEWKDYQFDFCAAPFGRGFFLSWWMLYKNPLGQVIFSKIPFIGKWMVRNFYPITYYKIDTASMFMTYAHQAVLNVIDSITKNNAVRSLSENERKPILNDIFKR